MDIFTLVLKPRILGESVWDEEKSSAAALGDGTSCGQVRGQGAKWEAQEAVEWSTATVALKLRSRAFTVHQFRPLLDVSVTTKRP